MYKCPSCGSEKFVNSVGPTGMIRTCKNPMCGGSLASTRYSWNAKDDEFHTKEAIEAAQAPKTAPEPVKEVVEAKPTPKTTSRTAASKKA